MVRLSTQWAQAFAEAIGGGGEDRQLSMAPSRLQEFIGAVRQTFERHAMMGESPVLLTSPPVRHFVRSIVERFRPSTVVLSQHERHAKARITLLGQICCCCAPSPQRHPPERWRRSAAPCEKRGANLQPQLPK